MPRKRNDISLADALREISRPVDGTVEARVPERYAHQAPGCAVVLFEREVCELAQSLINGNLVLYPDAKAALVRCIDELMIANSSKKDR